VTDNFALLGEPRRPWLDPERLKQKFLALSREAHPDRNPGTGAAAEAGNGERFAGINAAYNCLRDPRHRLRHLLQLETGSSSREAQSIPSELMDVSLAVGALCREADRFLDEKTAQTSALMRAQMFERGQELTDRVMEVQKQIADGRDQLLGEIQNLDAAWNDAAARPGSQIMRRLQEIESALGFAERWISQLRERVVRLAL
jgi:curved DNA-binding protein CbpA